MLWILYNLKLRDIMTENKVALVTGSSRGIGRGIALAIADHNWNEAIQYHINKSAAEEVKTLI